MSEEQVVAALFEALDELLGVLPGVIVLSAVDRTFAQTAKAER